MAASLEKPHHLGHRDRLRQRFKNAPDALADYELLELLLFRVIPRADTKPLAKSLLTRFGSLAEVLGAPEKLIAETPGVGPSIAMELKIVEAIAKRSARSMVMEREVLGSWSQVVQYCTTAMAYETREQFRVLFLDKRTASSLTRSNNKGLSIIPRSIRVKSCAARSSFQPQQLLSSTITHRATPHHRVPTSI